MAAAIGLKGTKILRVRDTTLGIQMSVPKGTQTARHLRVRAFLIAAVSDFLSFWMVLAPPMQWLIDLGTALLLFLILGRRWAILPGLIVEAIPGMGVFPVWVLAVLSIIAYDDIRGRKH